MSAGGTWTVQNKVRPGAYINFKAVAENTAEVGAVGTVTAALPMNWGPSGELITLYGSDLNDGSSLAKIGCTVDDIEESLPYRLLLSNCYKALLFRADEGGVKATGALTTVGDINAKYAGTVGNKISVSITAATPSALYSRVKVFVNAILQETFDVLTARCDGLEAIESEWVDFVIDAGQEATAIPATSGITLASGTNGTVTSTIATTYFGLIETAQWSCMTISSIDAAFAPLIYAEILKLRDSAGKKVQGVVYNDVSNDYEGIVAVKQGFKTAGDTVTTALFPLWVASLLAGAQAYESKTAFLVSGATEITGAISDDLIGDAISEGWFLLSYRQDGAVVVEKDVNCLHTFTADKPYAFSKNRVIRTLDEIGNSIALKFNTSFSGKVDNDAAGRLTFKSTIIEMMNALQGKNAIQNFNGTKDVTVLAGTDIDAVVVDLAVQPMDSMEKLYMTVNVSV